MRAKDRQAAESVFDRDRRREAEIKSALGLEASKHQAALKNMHRLRLLRLERDAKNLPTSESHVSQSGR
ncbi:MAG: hypothetical protein WBD90_11200 [Xanthobacteraceae bacterium]